MGQADQVPFLRYLLQTAQQKLAKPSGAFDLPEDGLYDFLALFVCAAAADRAQFARHPFLGRCVLGDATARGHLDFLAVLVPARCNVRINLLAFAIGHIVVAEVAVVGAEFLRFLAARVRFDFLNLRNLRHLRILKKQGINPRILIIYLK